jgi:hypothetical protein
MEPLFTIIACPRDWAARRRRGKKDWVAERRAKTFVSKIALVSDGEASRRGIVAVIPALFTKMSRPLGPVRFWTVSTASAIGDEDVTSRVMVLMLGVEDKWIGLEEERAVAMTR